MSLRNRVFRNKAPGPYLIGGLLVAFTLALATQCRADAAETGTNDPAPVPSVNNDQAAEETNGGYSDYRSTRIDTEAGYTVLRGHTPQFGLTVNFRNLLRLDTGDQGIKRDFDLQVGVGIIGEYEYKGKLESNQLYVHALVVDGFGRLDLGVGAAYLQNTDQLNGSNANFSLLIGYRFGARSQVKAYWRHFSNAGTKIPNVGRDFVGLAYSF